MSDLCIAEFNSRIARIEKARAKGYGFEAYGTLGRSSYTLYQRRKKRKVHLARPMMIVLLSGTLLKALFLQNLGIQAYDDRVARLLTGEGFDRIGGWIMQADPVTIAFANGIDSVLRL